jgi:taurine dioxygenase
MTPEATLGFARAFGRPQTQLLRYKRSGAVPEVSIMVSTLKTDGTTDKTALRAEDWHTDDSYFATPAKATLLHGIEIPSHGGATWFCNMHSAYEALPETLRRRIDGLRAIHGYDTPRARNRPAAYGAGDRRDARRRASAGAHPSRDQPQGALSQSQPAGSHRRARAGGE